MKNIILGILIGFTLSVIASGVITPGGIDKVEGAPVKRFYYGNQSCYYIIATSGVAISCL